MQSPKERYELMLHKLDALKESLHMIGNEELEEAIKQMEKFELIIKQLEDLYGDEL